MNLQIKMVGIDHNKAALAYRESFSFTQAEIAFAMGELMKEPGVKGCIILSTCNRTELWLSMEEDGASPYEMLCKVKRIAPDKYREFFIERAEEIAIFHLMEVACGLDSKIFGEDQIISQVGEALQLSRAHQCTDILLEKVFQTAIGAGKKVRTEVKLSEADSSAALQAVALLKERLGTLQGISALVIGNGQMGILAAEALRAAGAKVQMTLRKKLHKTEEKESAMPAGCTMIPYEERVEALSGAQVVISATRSPHYTLKKEEVKGHLRAEPSLWIDLAVPRDIDPAISQLGGVEIYDMDHIGPAKETVRNQEAMVAARQILKEYLEELQQWLRLRRVLPEIKKIVQCATEDVMMRIESPLEEGIKEEIRGAAEKALGKLFFGLKDHLQGDAWQECIEAIHQAALKDTLKS